MARAKTPPLEKDFDKAPEAEAESAAAANSTLALPNEGEAPPPPESIEEFLQAPAGTKMNRVRAAARRDRVVHFCTRANYQAILDEGGDPEMDLKAVHAIEVDSANFVRMNASDEYLMVTEKGSLLTTSQIVKAYIPDYHLFDDVDLAMVAASRNIDASQLDRDQLILVLKKEDDGKRTIDQMLAG